mmetsp:Transcript_16465/g.28746  ORF Transcript_16465/g.28746 Transcript_16465/m.28746 type:complete len:223 (+) Transcript_16465:40-708(+)|eukprot:CAMPEP_0171498260 /NCGR_PEP_ID=MMETSP0958-20121227/7748_1 /TAXON_ID=87120 /ORGANISM="Aurantiochytrium limacinum, Strain ATCCMYA-1381" /LENGTH=222 /DNA_ID=CAMNT_0012032633 /DNA_START=41 /DNA_END=709 /DNA_ORIENTATION=-
MSLFKKSTGKSTLKPVKSQATDRRATLSNYTKRTLGSGNLRAAVKVPEGEDVNEWIAANTVDFYNELSLLYGLAADDAKRFTKPGEGFPPNFEYRWADSATKKALRVSSPEYVDYVMTWIEDQIDNEEIFPVSEAQPFPDDFRDYILDIFKKMFRIFAILYHQHFTVIEDLGAAAHLNTCFKHFMFFMFEFDLAPENKEILALEGPVDRLRTQYEDQGDDDN